MNALVFEKPGDLKLAELPVPEITAPDQVLIKVAACGICGSDVKIMQGKHDYTPGIVLGHEFNGTVVDIGSAVTVTAVGDRVALDNNSRCGLCECCRMGFSSQCEELKNRTLGIYKNGGFAEYCLATQDVCFRIPDEIDEIVGTQVETLGTVLNGMNTVQMQPWDNVLVLGCGPIGYLFTSLARYSAAKVMVTEIDPFRYSIAQELGVTAVNPLELDIHEEIMRWSGNHKANVVIDAVGDQMQNAIDYVAPGGKILAFGMDSSFKAELTPYEITRRAIKILGTYIGQNTILPSIRILEAGKINMKHFFTGTVPLHEGVNAFGKLGLDIETMKAIPKKAMKIVLKP
ncbi:hypothetical protein BVY01_00545 [bacterium I07]|nr:hypothetical protein BVY01_00545 [bacterium I07]